MLRQHTKLQCCKGLIVQSISNRHEQTDYLEMSFIFSAITDKLGRINKVFAPLVASFGGRQNSTYFQATRHK